MDTLHVEDFSTQNCLWTYPRLSFSSIAQNGLLPPLAEEPLTLGNGDVGSYADSGQDECPCLALPPANSVHQHVHDYLGWNLDDAKDKLGEVDAEPKASQVHAHAVIREGNTKPAKSGWRWD